jgi:glutamyl-tRNA synthetase
MEPALRDGLRKIMREKVRTGQELADWFEPYLTEDFIYSDDARKKQFSNPDAIKLLSALLAGFTEISTSLDDAKAEAVCQKVALEASLKPAKVIHLVRASVSGRTVGPSLFALLTVLGLDRVKVRLGRTLALLKEGHLGVAA